MKRIHDLLSDVDRKWKPLGDEPVRLRIIGSAALMLQSDFERGTKDGDILEADEITSIDDIKAMSVRKLLVHKRLIDRFGSALDRFSADARAEDLPRFIKNLNSIERDVLGVSESVIDLPDWMQ